MLSGGNCGKGAIAAAVSDVAGGFVGSNSNPFSGKSLGSWGDVIQAAEVGLVGGGTAALSGGNFRDGFTTAAAGYLFNQTRHNGKDPYLRHLEGVNEAAAELKDEGFLIVRTEVEATNPNQPGYVRHYDIVVQDRSNGTNWAVEVKTSIVGVFRLDSRQVNFDVQTALGGTTFDYGTPIAGVMYRGVSFGNLAAAWSSATLLDRLTAAGVQPTGTLRGLRGGP
jgi:hypothetical protein